MRVTTGAEEASLKLTAYILPIVPILNIYPR